MSSAKEVSQLLTEKEALGGGTGIYEIPNFIPDYQVFVKAQSYSPPVKLFELLPCTQDGLKLSLQARDIDIKISKTIAEAICPKPGEKTDADTFIRMILLKDKGAVVIFTGNNDSLENIYVIDQNSKPRKISREQFSVFGYEKALIIKVDFSQIQKNPQAKVEITSYLPRTEFPLTPLDL